MESFITAGRRGEEIREGEREIRRVLVFVWSTI